MGRFRNIGVIGGALASSMLFFSKNRNTFSCPQLQLAVNEPATEVTNSSCLFTQAQNISPSNSYQLTKKSEYLQSLTTPLSYKNLTLKIAFLRLLGVKKLSLATLKEKGIAGCYCNALSALERSRITRSKDIVLRSIDEYRHVQFMYLDLPNNIFNLSEEDFREVRAIERSYSDDDLLNLYLELNDLSDDELLRLANDICKNVPNNQDFFESFRSSIFLARDACREYADRELAKPFSTKSM